MVELPKKSNPDEKKNDDDNIEELAKIFEMVTLVNMNCRGTDLAGLSGEKTR